jgi:dCMP deaminase
MQDKWIDRYFDIAKSVASWSKDSTKIGAVVVGSKGQILSQGYNGFPRGILDKEERLTNREEKYKFVVHAEMNCIYNATYNGVSLDGANLYVYGLPVCSECAKGVIQVGIRRIYMCHPASINKKWKDSFALTSQMFKEAQCSYFRYSEDGKCVDLHLNSEDFEANCW